MNFRVALNVLLVFCGGSVASWALISWINIGDVPNKQDGSIIVVAGLIGLIMFIIGFASQVLSKGKDE
jgi:hypothetical protein